MQCLRLVYGGATNASPPLDAISCKTFKISRISLPERGVQQFLPEAAGAGR